MEHYYVSKLEMILGVQSRETESENDKSTNDIDILEILLRQSPGNPKQTIDLLYAQIRDFSFFIDSIRATCYILTKGLGYRPKR